MRMENRCIEVERKKKQEKNKKNVRKCEGGRVEIKLETAKDRTKIG